MNNITSFFDKKKRNLSNNSNDGQDTKKPREASSLELSFEKASNGDVFKIGLSPSKKIIFLCFNESPLKIMKNAFYFISKVLFVLKIFKFLS